MRGNEGEKLGLREKRGRKHDGRGCINKGREE